MLLALIRHFEGLAVAAHAGEAVPQWLGLLELEVAAAAVVALHVEVRELKGAVFIFSPMALRCVVLVTVEVLPVGCPVAAVSLMVGS